MSAPRTETPYSAAFDAQQTPTTTFVSGTAGTSDINGTAEIIRGAADPTTGAQYVIDLSGATGTTSIQGSVVVIGGTLNAGTFTNLGTNVNIVTGTVNVGTFVMPSGTVTTGSLTTIANILNGSMVQTAGTLNTGTIQNLVSGTINALASGTITALPNNIVSSLGTAGDAGTLPVIAGENWFYGNTGARWARAREIENGVNSTGIGIQSVGLIAQFDDVAPTSITENQFGLVRMSANRNSYTTIRDAAGNERGANVTAASELLTSVNTGTLQSSGTTTGVGTVTNIGTMDILANGTIQIRNLNQGSITITTGTVTTGTLQNLNNGTLALVTTVSNVTNGSVNLLTGTVTSVTNLAAGTVQINQLPVVAGTSYGTLGTTGALLWGTLVAASGAGTKQYVSGVQIVVTSGTVDCAITNVGTIASPQGGNGVLARGQFGPGGGITENFFPVMPSGTNGTLAYFMGGAGTAYFIVRYWNGV